MTSRALHTLSRTATMLIAVVIVLVTALGLVRWFYGVPLSAFRPVFNDETSYWHQAFTFSKVGFSGGYYTTGELLNRSGITPFGPHGPGFPILYGAFGVLFGWYRHSPVVVNLVALSAAAW